MCEAVTDSLQAKSMINSLAHTKFVEVCCYSNYDNKCKRLNSELSVAWHDLAIRYLYQFECLSFGVCLGTLGIGPA